MYLTSSELLNEINEIANEIYNKTNGIVVFEEYIALPYYGNIILRFELNKDKYSLDKLDEYEALMYKMVNEKFLIDFMGSVYRKVGYNPQEANLILPKCYKKYHDEVITKSIHENKIKEDAKYLLEMCGLPKESNVWEIQPEDEINLFILGDEFKEIGNYCKDDLKMNVYEIGQLECEGLMKAAMYAKNHHISLVRALLDVESIQ